MLSNKNKQCEEGTSNLITNYETNFIQNTFSKQNSESLIINKSLSLLFQKNNIEKILSTNSKSFIILYFYNNVIENKLNNYIKKIKYLFCTLNISIFEYKFITSSSNNKNKNKLKKNYFNNIKNENSININSKGNYVNNENLRNIKHIVKKDLYIQKINNSLKAFNGGYPPKINFMYIGEFKIKNKNDFSYVNNNYVIIKGNQIPHCFLNHIMISNKKFIVKNRLMIQMIARRNKGKSIKIIYYKPLR